MKTLLGFSEQDFIRSCIKATDPTSDASSEDAELPMEVILALYPDLVMGGGRANKAATVKALFDENNGAFSELELMLYRGKGITAGLTQFLISDDDAKFQCSNPTEEFVLRSLTTGKDFVFTGSLKNVPVTERFRTAAYFYIISEWVPLTDPKEIAVAHIFARMVKAVLYTDLPERVRLHNAQSAGRMES